MKILIIGGGGREHALAWKAAQSPHVSEVFVAPGNAGTQLEPKLTNIAINAEDNSALLEFAQTRHIDLTIVGPEAPLVNGIVDLFQQHDLKIFGPTRAAAQLEGSKTFTKDFLARHKIPTAAYKSFTDSDKACAYLDKVGVPIVIKADGLAAGKGVILAHDMQQAKDTVNDMLAGNTFGQAGSRVVIEEFLYGEEASFICMVDGHHVLAMASSQDHKARDNGDKGPNTGGMGAYSPAPVLTPEIEQRVMQQVIMPTVDGMRDEGNLYTGFLYAGLMIAPNGDIKVLEYNCRFGDPETQPIMMRLESDLVTHCLAAIEGKLDTQTAQWSDKVSIGVVLAAGGYPFDYTKGDVISGIPDATPLSKTFHAGTAFNTQNELVTQGGRVLCCVALSDTLAQAQKNAYSLANAIHWKNIYKRDDIGFKAL